MIAIFPLSVFMTAVVAFDMLFVWDVSEDKDDVGEGVRLRIWVWDGDGLIEGRLSKVS